MSDTVKQVNELRIKCTLRNGTTQTTRTLTVNNPKTYDSEQRQRMLAFRDKLMTGSLSNVVQPANWRDDDDKTPYETAGVEFSEFTSTEVFRDLSDETPIDPSVLQITPSTVEAVSFGGASDPYNIEYVELQVAVPEGMTNPQLSASGRLPINNPRANIDFEGDYWTFKVEKQQATVSQGTNELTIHFTASDLSSNVATGDATITAVDGEGYAFTVG